MPTNGMDTDRSGEFILDAFRRREEMRPDLQEGMRRTGALLDVYRAELVKLFSSVAEKR